MVLVLNGNHSGFAGGEGDVAELVFGEAGLKGVVVRGLLHGVDGGERGVQGEVDAACGGFWHGCATTQVCLGVRAKVKV